MRATVILCGNNSICVQRDDRTIYYVPLPSEIDSTTNLFDWTTINATVSRLQAMNDDELDAYEMENLL